MFSLKRMRLKLQALTPSLSIYQPSTSDQQHTSASRWPKFDLSLRDIRSKWPSQRLRTPRLWSRIFIALFTICALYIWFSYQQPSRPLPPPEEPAPEPPGFKLSPPQYYNSSPHPPHIPPKIWQIYLDFKGEEMEQYTDNIHSWIAHSPSYVYTILDKAGALEIMSTLTWDARRSYILPLYESMRRRVMRADFLRYLLLAMEGGVYSDMDTLLVKPIGHWVPDEYKDATRLILGIEADHSPPIPGTSFETQFCQWTLAAAANHPVMWAMVESIREAVENRLANSTSSEFTDDDVLDITGPAGWTRVVYKFLSQAAGAPIDWRNITGLRSPRLYGDILVLPIDAFATGLDHSGSSLEDTPQTLVRHLFGHSWRDGVN